MKFDHQHYVPCIRWKYGEYQAILDVSTKHKNSMTPLIEVPEIGFDFETQTPTKSIDDHLAPFAGRVSAKWGERSCFVDLRLVDPSQRMADGQHPAKFIFDDLRLHGCTTTPVTGLGRDRHYRQAIRGAAKRDGRGVGIRVTIEEADKPDVKSSVSQLCKRVGVGVKECHFILDLRAPHFEPLDGFTRLVERIYRGLPYLNEWQTLTLIGTSFPASMAEVKRSPALIQRSEWRLYKTLARRLAENGIRVPTFGDYGINHTEVPSVDMRKVKPSATIRYTIDDAWLIIKGPNVRDHGYEQYRDHCKTLMGSRHYLGRNFSWGDEYIAGCAEGTAKTGNLSTWRRVGTNHHLEKVAREVASFSASLSTL